MGGEAVGGRDVVGCSGQRERNRTAVTLEAGAELGREEDEEGSDSSGEGIVLPRPQSRAREGGGSSCDVVIVA